MIEDRKGQKGLKEELINSTWREGRGFKKEENAKV